jgi:hypothetical protein
MVGRFFGHSLVFLLGTALLEVFERTITKRLLSFLTVEQQTLFQS